jgi:hypothetical protein
VKHTPRHILEPLLLGPPPPLTYEQRIAARELIREQEETIRRLQAADGEKLRELLEWCEAQRSKTGFSGETSALTRVANRIRSELPEVKDRG